MIYCFVHDCSRKRAFIANFLQFVDASVKVPDKVRESGRVPARKLKSALGSKFIIFNNQVDF